MQLQPFCAQVEDCGGNRYSTGFILLGHRISRIVRCIFLKYMSNITHNRIIQWFEIIRLHAQLCSTNSHVALIICGSFVRSEHLATSFGSVVSGRMFCMCFKRIANGNYALTFYPHSYEVDVCVYVQGIPESQTFGVSRAVLCA